MQFIALRELPQGQQPGETFEATEDAGMVLVQIGAAKRVEDVVAPVPAPRRRYTRRDLEAEPA